MKVLMVCLGNICRSPMAEGILRHKAKQRNIDIETDSCGTSSYHIGEHPDSRAISNLSVKSVDISDLRARQFSISDFDEFDIIYCMDTSNYNDIIVLTDNENHIKKVKMILNEVTPGGNKAVPDPYFGGDDGFETVFHLLDQACEKILDNISE